MNSTIGIGYIEFQNVSAGPLSSYLPLLQLALSCVLQTTVYIRWFIEKTGTSHTLYNDIRLPPVNLTYCEDTIWPTYHNPPTSPYSVGANYGISELTPEIVGMNLLTFNERIAKANQTNSIATLLGSPYFFSAAPVQLLHLPAVKYTQLPTSSAVSLTLGHGAILIVFVFILQSIV